MSFKENFQVDFVDINCGCPIDLINEKGGGCTLASRSNKLIEVMRTVSKVIGNVPLTLKLRTGIKVSIVVFLTLTFNFILINIKFNLIYLKKT